MAGDENNVEIQFSEAEHSRIDSCAITMLSGRNSNAIKLADAWAAHVNKLDLDRVLPQSDHSVWNEFDLCAALSLREYLESALKNLPKALMEKVSKYASRPDDRFFNMTVLDSGKRMAAIAEIDLEGRGWWWFRVPDSGPIVEDLARWSRYDEHE